MKQNVFCIDGQYFNARIPVEGIKRSFSVADSDKAGRNLTGRMIRDIIGTFYNYTITIDTNKLSQADYDDLYEIISAPVESHTITIPYGQETKTFDVYITSGDDVLVKSDKTGNTWKGLQINLIAMEPLRKPGE